MNESITLTLKSSKDILPAHEESIVYFKKINSWDSYGYEPHYDTVEHCWFEVDKEGRFTGNQASYTEGDEQEDGWKLMVCVDGYTIGGESGIDIYWMTEEDWYNSFPMEEE